MLSRSPPPNVDVLLNFSRATPPSRKHSADYRPRKATQRLQEARLQSPNVNSRSEPLTPQLPPPPQYVQSTFKNKADYNRLAEKFTTYMAKKGGQMQSKTQSMPKKREQLNAMFKNIKQVLKDNQKKNKQTRQGAELTKDGLTGTKSNLHRQLFLSEDKMEFYRLTKIPNQMNQYRIKNAMNPQSKRYLLNPFSSSTIACQTVSPHLATLKQISTALENSLVLRSNNTPLLRRSVVKTAFPRSMSFHVRGEADSSYPKKIKSLLQFIFKVNFSSNLYVDLSLKKADQSNQIPKVKVMIGRGNNCLLVKSLIKRRFWWEITHKPNDKDIVFYWTQHSLCQIHGQQTKAKIPQIPRTETTRISKRKKGMQHLYQLNQKLLSEESSVTVQKFILPQAFGIPFKEAFQPQVITNHIVSNHCIGSKKNLFKSLYSYHLNITKKNPFDYIPKTYHIRSLQDPNYALFLAQNEQDPSKIWIVKPGENTNRGKSINLAPFSSILPLLSKAKHQNGQQLTYIIQSYINRPFLYNNRKFDIRHFMLLTSVNGCLKAYWYKEGYLRTSSYWFDLNNTNNLYIHLTNDAIQKQSEFYQKYEPGNKVSYNEFQRYLDYYHNSKGYKFEDILCKMKNIAVDIVKANYKHLDPQRLKNNFEVIGLDFMIDKDFKPWLIEANYNPCLQVNCPVLQRIIPAMLQNTFRLALDPLYPPPCHYPPSKRFFLADNYLKHLKYELIFDQNALIEPIINPYEVEENQGEEQEQFPQEGKQIQQIQL